MRSFEVAGRYQVEERIGGGGMASVYRATDLVLHRTVALKLLREELAEDPTFVRRFQREARAAATLSHPNIVSVYDLGLMDRTHFIVMEYLAGEDLKEIIRREGALPAATIVRIGVQLAEALDHAHLRGIVHRDIKPQNVLITPDGQVKVTDFGIAGAVGASELTSPGMVMGTPVYSSPEQVQGLPVGPPSDIYSAGLVLYEMATGRPPFRASNPVAAARMHVEDPPPRPRALNPALPPGLEAIILKALSKEPSRRFSTAGELGRELMDLDREGGQLTQAQPPNQVAVDWPILVPAEDSPGRTWSARNLGPWIAGAALLLALVLVLPLLVSTLRGEGSTAGRTTPPEVAGAPPPSPPAGPTPTLAGSAALPKGSPTASPPAPSAAGPPVVPTASNPTVPAPPPPTRTAAPEPTVTALPAATSTPPGPSPGAATPPSARPTATVGPASPALQAAVGRVAQAGYEVLDRGTYDESQELRVLIGSAGEYDQKAFFFLGNSYLGTDTLNPSAQVSFGGQDGNVISIVYALYRPEDPMSSPSGGAVGVRYQWNGTRLIPLDPIPPEDATAGLSRR